MFVLQPSFLNETASVEKNVSRLAEGVRITEGMRAVHDERQMFGMKIVVFSIAIIYSITGCVFNGRSFLAAQRFSLTHFTGTLSSTAFFGMGVYLLIRELKSRSSIKEKLDAEINKVQTIYSNIVKDIDKKLQDKQLKIFADSNFTLDQNEENFINNLKLAIKETKEEEKLIHTIWEGFKKSANEYISFIDSKMSPQIKKN